MDAYLGRDVVVIDKTKGGENGDRLSTLPKGSLVVIPSDAANDPYVRVAGLSRLMTVGNHIILEKN